MYCRARSGRRGRRILLSFSLRLPARSFRSSRVPFSEERCKGPTSESSSLVSLSRYVDVILTTIFTKGFSIFTTYHFHSHLDGRVSTRLSDDDLLPLRSPGIYRSLGPQLAAPRMRFHRNRYRPPPTYHPRRHFPLSDFFVQSRVNGSSRRRPRNRFFYIYTRWINRSCMRVIAKNG